MSDLTWTTKIFAITLVVEDLAVAREFYARAFELPEVFADDASVLFTIGDTHINLLVAGAAPDLVAPHPVGTPGGGMRAMYTIPVDDVDAIARRLTESGVELLRGPEDRPWGIRTVTFEDPFGHTWEISS